MTTTVVTRYDENNYWTEAYDLDGKHTGGYTHYEEILSGISKSYRVTASLELMLLTETYGTDTATLKISKSDEVPEDVQYHSNICNPGVNSWNVGKLTIGWSGGGGVSYYAIVFIDSKVIVTESAESLAAAEAITELTGPDGTVYRKGEYHSDHSIMAETKYYAIKGPVSEKRFRIILEVLETTSSSTTSSTPATTTPATTQIIRYDGSNYWAQYYTPEGDQDQNSVNHINYEEIL